jgi:AGZA family xanthine/uracil permease-like MFS transporter
MVPVLVFIGLEITAQAFLASPTRHGTAVAITFVPTAAAMVLIEVNAILAALGRSTADLTDPGATAFQGLLVLGNGFILTAILWGTGVATVIDRRFDASALVFVVASGATLVGLVHSPLPDGALFWPWAPPSPVTASLAGTYGVLAIMSWAIARWSARRRD